jgi:hypothetical protein
MLPCLDVSDAELRTGEFVPAASTMCILQRRKHNLCIMRRAREFAANAAPTLSRLARETSTLLSMSARQVVDAENGDRRSDRRFAYPIRCGSYVISVPAELSAFSADPARSYWPKQRDIGGVSAIRHAEPAAGAGLVLGEADCICPKLIPLMWMSSLPLRPLTGTDTITRRSPCRRAFLSRRGQGAPTPTTPGKLASLHQRPYRDSQS